MKPLTITLLFVFVTLAALEHVGLLLWGVVWPLRHLSRYPDDGGVNLFTIAASLLFLAFSLGGAAAVRPSVAPLATLAAMTMALPCGVVVLLTLMRVLFLDPVVAYLTLLPAIAAVLTPYVLAAFLARHHLQGSPAPMRS